MDGPMDGWTYGLTLLEMRGCIYRDARTHLKLQKRVVLANHNHKCHKKTVSNLTQKIAFHARPRSQNGYGSVEDGSILLLHALPYAELNTLLKCINDTKIAFNAPTECLVIYNTHYQLCT